MSDIDKDQLTRIIGRFSGKYGLQMDELTATILCEVEETGAGIAKTKDLQIDKLLKSYQPFHTNDYRAAFAYSFGKTVWLILLAMSILIAVSLHHVRETTRSEYREAAQILSRYPNVVELEPVLKNAKIVANDDGTFLQFNRPDKGKMILGRSFVVEDKTNVLIPLRFK
ncbi:hypothetical protein SAMN05216327_11836 [Dyadobacter sp. SG02]|uniref:hypothetical protein n=1 Tax=Dyadobacter sp. SG02 TaxID=1855291 RepID=UPI0008C0BA61|nr:hypothetical protein [Dyadobacter sp. SG02]SEJ74609.1 hypothetical protein SAMN05216327_11836 [Dyadobacter sp. SG02]